MIDVPFKERPDGQVSAGSRSLALSAMTSSVSDRCERVVLGLEPYELGLQVTDTLLKAPHLRNHAGVRTADVAE